MSTRSAALLVRRGLSARKNRVLLGSTAARAFASSEGLPDSIKRVGQASAFPNEYPGQVYAFNWCLNKDGVTPLQQSAFRITKSLDLRVAGLTPPGSMPLKIKAAAASKMPEAGSESLEFSAFDASSEQTRDLLSLSDHLYCPEGHVPGTRTSVRIITNSSSLAPNLLAYLERAPRKDPPESLPITVYALEGSGYEFAGYAIEEVEVPIIDEDDGKDWSTGDGNVTHEAKSVAAVVVAGSAPDISLVVAGIELSQKALAEDEEARAAEKAEKQA
ncbi:Phosphoenolpyruvate carboxykinase [Seminavis robusta]|uniref:Phosphoenolpyruvate carboxykinase n=1 Tax=Seminavis robusta TaxID=568900 RepID=A0A9N8HFF6_9STRA|nr:Phosphoenolpyruvate carboxykinase [Seminavis robusta]|eukprot:Sro567_g168090.1 Phosphoenolpyruvate carboxykinase (274) ;mRNA; f:54649-55694